MPLLNNNCIMNTLSKYVEDMEFDNKWKINKEGFDYHILLSDKYDINDKKLITSISKIIKEFNKSQVINIIKSDYIDENTNEEFEDNSFRYLFEYYENKLLKLCSNKEKLADYVIYVFYNKFSNKSKSLMWNVFGENIVNNIKHKSKTVCFPIRDENGTEYLGQRYSLKEIVNEF